MQTHRHQIRASLLILMLTIYYTPEGRAAGVLNELMSLLGDSSITDEQGHVVDLLSPAALRAEFRALSNEFQKVDLQGPPVETDGWTHNIPEAEWPFMGFAYFGYASLNLAQQDKLIHDAALAETRWLLKALQQPRMTGFVTPHFGAPFGTKTNQPSVFVHGHFLNLAIRYRQANGDLSFDGLIHQVAESLSSAFSASDQGILRSYKDMWWLSDNFVALSALCQYDGVFQKQLSAPKVKIIRSIKEHYLDTNGLFCTYIDVERKKQLQGARGISLMYGLHFLPDIDPAFARGQYQLARRLLLFNALGHAAVREFPQSTSGQADVDSGPLVFDFGPSASGFAIAAAMLQQDRETGLSLIRSVHLIGFPKFANGQLSFQSMPPVGQAVILYGKTLLMAAPGQ